MRLILRCSVLHLYLQDGVSNDNVVHTVLVIHGGVHGNFQPVEYEGSETEHQGAHTQVEACAGHLTSSYQH